MLGDGQISMRRLVQMAREEQKCIPHHRDDEWADGVSSTPL